MPLRLITLLFPLLPLGAYLLTEALFFSQANLTLGGLEARFDAEDLYGETALRYRFLTITLIYLIVALVVCGLFFAELARGRLTGTKASTPRYKTRSIIAALVIFVVITGVVTALVIGPNNGKLYAALGLDVFRLALSGCAALTSPDCVFGGSAADGIASGFEFTINLGAAATVAAVTAAAIGTGMALNQPEERLKTAPRTELFKLPREFLYLSSVLFTIGMAALVIWTGWPKVVLEGAALESYAAVQRAANMYYGVAFSAIILSYYLPAVILLNMQLDQHREVRAPLDQGDTEAALPASPRRIVENVLAFVSPMLTALIAGGGAQLFNQIGVG